MPSPAPLGAWVIDVKSLSLNPKDSVMTNAQKIRAVLGGGTDCAAPMKNLNDRNEKADVCFLISDNQSWIGTYNQFYSYYDASDFNKVEPTKLMTEWKKFRTNNPGAKLVVLDIQPSTTTQAYETEDILNISGFGDHVFEIVSQFAEGRLDQGHWTKVIDDIQL
jgi:60 kDa SS-A/Ro ribonucleoprotein